MVRNWLIDSETLCCGAKTLNFAFGIWCGGGLVLEGGYGDILLYNQTLDCDTKYNIGSGWSEQNMNQVINDVRKSIKLTLYNHGT